MSNKYGKDTFVNNDYFATCGLSRQVVRYGIEREKIKPLGILLSMKVVKSIIDFKKIDSIEKLKKSPYLYNRLDADLFILRYWVENYKRYLREIITLWEKFKNEEPFKNRNESDKKELQLKILNTDEFLDYLPDEIKEFIKIVNKYFDFKTGKPINPESSFFCDFSREYIKGILNRNERFILSNKSVEAFLYKESQDKFQGKEHLDIERERQIQEWFDNEDFPEIESLLMELRQRKDSPPLEDESKDFYKLAKSFYVNLKKKKR